MKHTPATPLRLATARGWLVTTKHETDIGLNAKCLAKIEPNADAAVQAWADRANAYPRLVADCKDAIAGLELANTPEARNDIALQLRSLLRELGELP